MAHASTPRPITKSADRIRPRDAAQAPTAAAPDPVMPLTPRCRPMEHTGTDRAADDVALEGALSWADRTCRYGEILALRTGRRRELDKWQASRSMSRSTAVDCPREVSWSTRSSAAASLSGEQGTEAGDCWLTAARKRPWRRRGRSAPKAAGDGVRGSAPDTASAPALVLRVLLLRVRFASAPARATAPARHQCACSRYCACSRVCACSCVCADADDDARAKTTPCA